MSEILVYARSLCCSPENKSWYTSAQRQQRAEQTHRGQDKGAEDAAVDAPAPCTLPGVRERGGAPWQRPAMDHHRNMPPPPAWPGPSPKTSSSSSSRQAGGCPAKGWRALITKCRSGRFLSSPLLTGLHFLPQKQTPSGSHHLLEQRLYYCLKRRGGSEPPYLPPAHHTSTGLSWGEPSSSPAVTGTWQPASPEAPKHNKIRLEHQEK